MTMIPARLGVGPFLVDGLDAHGGDAIADVPVFDAVADLFDRASGVPAEDHREVCGLGGQNEPGAGADVYGVHGGRCHLELYLARSRCGNRQVLRPEPVRAAERVDDLCVERRCGWSSCQSL